MVLSARDNEKLLEQANRLFSALKANPGYSLADVAHTLQVGRDHHICRLAIMADSREDLLGKLEKIGAGEDSPAGVYRGEAARGATALSQLSADADFRHTVGRWAAQGKTAMLADMWTQGLDVDWAGLDGAAKPGRCSLPGYPFARERSWIDCDRPGFENRARQIRHPRVHA